LSKKLFNLRRRNKIDKNIAINSNANGRKKRDEILSENTGIMRATLNVNELKCRFEVMVSLLTLLLMTCSTGWLSQLNAVKNVPPKETAATRLYARGGTRVVRSVLYHGPGSSFSW